MRNLKKATFLVTGASGFVGSHLIKRLEKEGHKVIKLDYSGKKLDMKVDMTKVRPLKQMLKKIEAPQVVIHLAACVDSKKDYLTGKKTIHTNILGTLNLLEAIRDLNIELFVHVGTQEVYGANVAPSCENDKIDPQTPYAITKASAEDFVQMYHRLYNLPVALLRFAAIFGPGQNPTKFIPYCIISALNGRDIVLHSPKQKRDFLYIDDAIEAIYKVCLSGRVNNEIINLGGLKPYLIKDVAELILKNVGNSAKIYFKEDILLSSNPEYVINDISKAKTLLGWVPTVSLERGLKRTANWYRKTFASLSRNNK